MMQGNERIHDHSMKMAIPGHVYLDLVTSKLNVSESLFGNESSVFINVFSVQT